MSFLCNSYSIVSDSTSISIKCLLNTRNTTSTVKVPVASLQSATLVSISSKAMWRCFAKNEESAENSA